MTAGRSTVAAVSVVGSGLVTAVGFNSAATCAAMRAGIRNVSSSNFWHAQSGTFIGVGRVPLPHWWEAPEVLGDLVTPAILECLDAASSVPPSEIPVLLGIPGSDRLGRAAGLDPHILDEVADRLGFELHPSSRVIPGGHVSGCLGIAEAWRLIDKEGVRRCVVAAVDTLVRSETVEAYLKRGRILTETNSDGFSPGEAGAAVLVAPAGEQSGLEILGLGFAREPATINSDDPLRGEGLTDAIRRALAQAGLEMKDIGYRLADMNGERYKFKEASFALGRLLKERVPSLDLWHPVEFLGDIGAAIGPSVIALALHAGQKGYAPGRTVLCHFGSDDGERAALVARFVPDHDEHQALPSNSKEDG